MSNTSVLSTSGYSNLLGDIRKILTQGKTRAAIAVKDELINAYWEIGKRIHQERLTQNAGYYLTVLDDLSDELDLDVTTLKRCIYFFQAYKSAPRGTNLNWSHFRALLHLNDGSQRKWYEQLAIKNKLTSAQLGKSIKDDRYMHAHANKNTGALSPKIYRPTEASYIYKALVERVIDGDTLMLRIDLGFGVFKKQRLRLAEIDAPAMDEPNGKESTTYVSGQLAKAAFVIVKTNKIDIYGRYVGHVFYSFKENNHDMIFTKGRYLNQELIDRGLARIL